MNKEQVHAAILFKDFSEWSQPDIDAESCVGLNIAALTIAQALQLDGIDATVYPVKTNVNIVGVIERCANLTHVIIFAPWLSVWDVRHLIEGYPNIQFVIMSHSNIGFLHADPDAIYLLRSYLELSRTHDNLMVAGNSPRFVQWMRLAYDEPVLFLPNMYPELSCIKRERSCDGILRLGMFGAVRPEKNFVTAAAAAVAIHRLMGGTTELHMSANYDIPSGVIESTIEQVVANVPGFTLVKHEWMHWREFTELIGAMDLLIQPSYTESFNIVTADGIAMGVPSVVSPAIYWVPRSWKADSDNAFAIAKVGIRLLSRDWSREGEKFLRRHNENGLDSWEQYLLA